MDNTTVEVKLGPEGFFKVGQTLKAAAQALRRSDAPVSMNAVLAMHLEKLAQAFQAASESEQTTLTFVVPESVLPSTNKSWKGAT